MFDIGQNVICGNKGVCTIADITTLDISGTDKERKYYILKPLYVTSSTVYIPVDSAPNSMRNILTKEEAESLIHSIPELPLLQIKNDKFLEQDYKTCMKANCCDEWVRLIKTIYNRRQSRLQTGRKETAIDSRYYKMAEDILYGELAVALDIEKSQVEPYIISQLQE